MYRLMVEKVFLTDEPKAFSCCSDLAKPDESRLVARKDYLRLVLIAHLPRTSLSVHFVSPSLDISASVVTILIM